MLDSNRSFYCWARIRFEASVLLVLASISGEVVWLLPKRMGTSVGCSLACSLNVLGGDALV